VTTSRATSSPGIERGLRETDELTPLLAYEWMLRIRAFESRCRALSDDGAIAGSIHLCAGQEAIPVGVVSLLRPGDGIVATYRGHGWAIATGVPLPDLLAEVCHRATGTNGGRAGSPYLSSPRHGFAGENSVVGAGMPIAAGISMASKLSGTQDVTVVSIGDGATNQGATHEALVLAASRSLPLVVVCENNEWSEMTNIREIVRIQDLADRAASYGIPGAVVDGCDPGAVRDAMSIALEQARRGDGPSFVEARTVRLWGHYNADIEHYRPPEDKESAAERDPIATARRALLAGGATEQQLGALERAVEAELDAAEAFARESPFPEPVTARDHVVGPRRTPEPKAHPPSSGQEMTYIQAVNLALRHELEERSEVVVFGEDVGVAGGVFGATRRLQADFGSDRVFDTPIAESAILGAAVGLAISGKRPIAEIMWSDFLLVALDQLVNQAANVRYTSLGLVAAPLLVRTQQGATPGSCAQHSQSLEALLTHIPGLRVGMPSTPQDAYSMLRAAVADDDPCILIESRALYQRKGSVVAVPDAEIGGAALHADGDDLAIVTWGRMTDRARAAVETLSAEDVDATLLELRWLSPLDDAALADAVRRCGRVLIVHEANLTGGFGAEIAAIVADRHFDHLDAPVRRHASPDVRFPASPVLQDALLPSSQSIVAMARDLLRV
jgi:2-oxoisovalerate dehydrogenase E1 component